MEMQRCSASARRMERTPPAGTISRMAAKISSEGCWALGDRERRTHGGVRHSEDGVAKGGVVRDLSIIPARLPLVCEKGVFGHLHQAHGLVDVLLLHHIHAPQPCLGGGRAGGGRVSTHDAVASPTVLPGNLQVRTWKWFAGRPPRWPPQPSSACSLESKLWPQKPCLPRHASAGILHVNQVKHVLAATRMDFLEP